MAIEVICPGCMTRFQVGDQFAGKKGPCPKCGHIIEIPKEKLVIHAPDDITSGGKTVKGGNTLRPILQTRFHFTIAQISLALLGIFVTCAIAYLFRYWQTGLIKDIVGLLGVFIIGFPLTSFGYMMIRDENDLEILLGNELYKRSALTAACFTVVWLIFELFYGYLNPGPAFIVYFIPIVILGAIAAMMIFDDNFGKGVLLFLLTAFSVVILRGLMFTPDGWLWEYNRPEVRAVTPVAQEKSTPESSENTTSKPSEAPKKMVPTKPLSREAPNPSKQLRR